MTDTTETARALLWRHNLPEDVIDGALALHAQELAQQQRAAHDTQRPFFHGGLACKPDWDCGVKRIIDLIDPTLAERPAPAAVPAADRAAVEEIARLRDAEARVRSLHDNLAAETDLTSPDDPITRGAAARRIAAALDGHGNPAAARRVAAETPQQALRCSLAVMRQPHGPHGWEPQPGMDPVRCPGACCCDHPDDAHSVYGCEDGCPCEYLPARRPAAPAQPGKEA